MQRILLCYWRPDRAALALLSAALVAAATAGCELDDCTDKAVVAFFVQEALTNVSNAYLAFSTVSDTVLYSEKDFEERAAVFAETLQEVANLNANLTDYFVSVPRLPACLANCLAAMPGRTLQQPSAHSHLLYYSISW
jgi:hypothetical protein